MTSRSWAQWQTQDERSLVRKVEDCSRAELCDKYGIDYATLTRLQQEGQSTPISRQASFQHGHKLNLQGPISFKITSSQQQKAPRLEQGCSLCRTATTLMRTRLFGYLCLRLLCVDERNVDTSTGSHYACCRIFAPASCLQSVPTDLKRAYKHRRHERPSTCIPSPLHSTPL